MQNQNYERFVEAKNLMKKFNFFEAIKILEELIELEPNDSMIKFYYGKCLVKKNKAQAKRVFEEILDSDSRNFVLVELAKIEEADENFDKAREYLEKLKEFAIKEKNKKDEMIAELELGRIDVAQCLYLSARTRFEKVKKEGNEKDKTYAYQESGKLYVMEEDYDSARKEFKKLLYINNGKSKNFALLELGILETTVRNNDLARDYFCKLRKSKNKKDVGCALIELGKLEMKLGNYDQSEQYLNELINESNYSKDINLAKLLLGIVVQNKSKDSDRYEKAKEYFTSLLKTENREYALIELANLELNKKNYNQAKEYLRMLGYPKKQKLRSRKKLISGVIAISSGDNEEARNHLEPLIDCTDARIKYQAIYQLAYLEFREMNLAKSKNYFSKLLACMNLEHKAAALLNLIFIDLKEENYENALAKINEYKDNVEIISAINQGTWEDVMFYTKYKLGMKYERKKDAYFCNQVTSYDENRAIDYIISELGEDECKKNRSLIGEGIIELFNQIKINIQEVNPTSFSVVDKYKVNCGKVIGRIKDQETSTVIAQTLLNTKNIISVYPVYDGKEGSVQKVKK